MRPNGPRGALRKLNVSLAKRLNARLFNLGDTANRKVLWADVGRRGARTDAVDCLRALLPRALEVTARTVAGYFEELAASELLQRSLDRYATILEKARQPSLANVVTAENLFCYVATRCLKPSTVIETGCATGWSSALFLLAMYHNQHGHLYSIDLPPVAGQLSMEWGLPPGLDVGFYVPEELRSRWSLTLGNARMELIPLLERVGGVDIFRHDSDHTYVHMMWEYTAVWPYLALDGLLVSDDIGWNTAFWDFATAVGRPMVIHRSNTNFGVLSRS